MKYTQGTFTLPASSSRTSQQNWDPAFLSEAEFSAKYGPQPEEPTQKPLRVLGEETAKWIRE